MQVALATSVVYSHQPSTQQPLQFTKTQVAVQTEAANEQHYEVPTAFFLAHLGPRRKYSSCEWPKSVGTLAEAENYTLAEYCRRLGLNKLSAGANVLEVGCGWGSLSLFMAEKYPTITFRCFSNSETQIAFIKAEARRK